MACTATPAAVLVQHDRLCAELAVSGDRPARRRGANRDRAAFLARGTERLRGMVRERQCLAGEELQRLTKLEELDALRSGVVGRNTHLLIPDEVAECMRIRGGGHHPSGHWTLDTEFG